MRSFVSKWEVFRWASSQSRKQVGLADSREQMSLPSQNCSFPVANSPRYNSNRNPDLSQPQKQIYGQLLSWSNAIPKFIWSSAGKDLNSANLLFANAYNCLMHINAH